MHLVAPSPIWRGGWGWGKEITSQSKCISVKIQRFPQLPCFFNLKLPGQFFWEFPQSLRFFRSKLPGKSFLGVPSVASVFQVQNFQNQWRLGVPIFALLLLWFEAAMNNLGVPSVASLLRDDSWSPGNGSEGSAEAKPPHSPHFPFPTANCHPEGAKRLRELPKNPYLAV